MLLPSLFPALCLHVLHLYHLDHLAHLRRPDASSLLVRRDFRPAGSVAAYP